MITDIFRVYKKKQKKKQLCYVKSSDKKKLYTISIYVHML